VSFFDVPSVSASQWVPQQKYQTVLLNLMQLSSGTWLGVFLMHNPHLTLLTVKFRQPSHEFTFGVGMTFVSYPLLLTPLV
jgi:hypothetical protein